MNEEEAQQFKQLEAQIKRAFTKDALLRYGTIKSASEQRARAVLLGSATLLQQGRVKEIDDETLKKLLTIMTAKREMKITRK